LSTAQALTLWHLAVRVRRGQAVELDKQLANMRHILGVKLLDVFRVDGDTDATCSGMNTEWRLEQMVAVLGHLGIDTGVGVLQDNIFDCALIFLEKWVVAALVRSVALLEIRPLVVTCASGVGFPCSLKAVVEVCLSVE
jgi:hypothetical protein